MDFIVKNIIVALAIASPFIIYILFKSTQKGVKYLAVKNKKKCVELINNKYPNNTGIFMPNDENKFWEVVLEIGKFKKNPAKAVNVYFTEEEPIRIIKEEHHIRGKNGEREIVNTIKF